MTDANELIIEYVTACEMLGQRLDLLQRQGHLVVQAEGLAEVTVTVSNAQGKQNQKLYVTADGHLQSRPTLVEGAAKSWKDLWPV